MERQSNRRRIVAVSNHRPNRCSFTHSMTGRMTDAAACMVVKMGVGHKTPDISPPGPKPSMIGRALVRGGLISGGLCLFPSEILLYEMTRLYVKWSIHRRQHRNVGWLPMDSIASRRVLVCPLQRSKHVFVCLRHLHDFSKTMHQSLTA